MLLSKLFKGAPEIEIEQLSTDSRLPMKNAIFFCMSGIKYDGHEYVEEAVKNGAKVIVYSEELSNKPKALYVRVKDVSDALKKVANAFYGYPAHGLETYIVSGTYGRSSVAKIINHVLNKFTLCAYVGILGISYKNLTYQMSFPTMSSLDNIKALYNLKNQNIKAVTLEATSSALNLKKLDILSPDLFVFTGCNETSSEYYSSNKEYYNWIRRYLYTLEDHTRVVLNRDDRSFTELNDSVAHYVTFGFNDNADYRISNEKLYIDSTSFDLYIEGQVYHVTCGLKGRINIYNITAAIVSLYVNGYKIEDIIEALKDIKDIDGIYQRVDDHFNILIDCAHDICSVEEIEKYARSVTKGKLITLYGINYYDEDNRIKKLCSILNEFSDVVVLTEDGSYEGEVSDILSRCDKYNTAGKFVKCIYRSIAIENAIELMNDDDTLLILGKGNEDFLIMGLGKENYYGDYHYAVKYSRKRKEEQNETV